MGRAPGLVDATAKSRRGYGTRREPRAKVGLACPGLAGVRVDARDDEALPEGRTLAGFETPT